MVDIDDSAGHPGTEFTGENLHVARQSEQIDLLLLQDSEQLLLPLWFVTGTDWYVVIRQTVPFSQRAQLFMIRYDSHNLCRQCATVPAVEQVIQAMAVSGHGKQYPHRFTQIEELPLHAIKVCELPEFPIELTYRRQRLGALLKFHTHEEMVSKRITMLRGIVDS